jgi:3-deoxy-D-manno-octulosonic-acid transferase
VVFGPYNVSFKDTVKDLLAAEAGIQVATTEELTEALERLVFNPSERRSMGQRARGVVLNGQGATDRNYALLTRYLKTARRRSDAQSGSSWLAASRHAN